MSRHLGTSSNLTIAVTALVMGATAQVSRAQDGNGIPFAEADVLAELNNTDGDLGFMPRSMAKLGSSSRSKAQPDVDFCR